MKKPVGNGWFFHPHRKIILNFERV